MNKEIVGTYNLSLILPENEVCVESLPFWPYLLWTHSWRLELWLWVYASIPRQICPANPTTASWDLPPHPLSSPKRGPWSSVSKAIESLQFEVHWRCRDQSQRHKYSFTCRVLGLSSTHPWAPGLPPSYPRSPVSSPDQVKRQLWGPITRALLPHLTGFCLSGSQRALHQEVRVWQTGHWVR